MFWIHDFQVYRKVFKNDCIPSPWMFFSRKHPSRTRFVSPTFPNHRGAGRLRPSLRDFAECGGREEDEAPGMEGKTLCRNPVFLPQKETDQKTNPSFFFFAVQTVSFRECMD